MKQTNQQRIDDLLKLFKMIPVFFSSLRAERGEDHHVPHNIPECVQAIRTVVDNNLCVPSGSITSDYSNALLEIIALSLYVVSMFPDLFTHFLDVETKSSLSFSFDENSNPHQSFDAIQEDVEILQDMHLDGRNGKMITGLNIHTTVIMVIHILRRTVSLIDNNLFDSVVDWMTQSVIEHGRSDGGRSLKQILRENPNNISDILQGVNQESLLAQRILAWDKILLGELVSQLESCLKNQNK